MTSKNYISFDFQALQRMSVLTVAVILVLCGIPSTWGQNFPSAYSTVTPDSGDYSPYQQYTQQVTYPPAPSNPQSPNQFPTYGGMPISSTQSQQQNLQYPNQTYPQYPIQQAPVNPTEMSSGQIQPTPLQPVQMMPVQNTVPQLSQPVQLSQQPQLTGIQNEQQGLAVSNAVFDNEVDRMMQGMQNTAPSLGMETFRTGSSEMIPQGIQHLQPVESERDASQLQSQVFAMPSTPGGMTPLFGAETERSLTETNDTSDDFSAILQTQQRLGGDFQGTIGNVQNNVPGLAGDAFGGKTVDLFDKKADDEVENLTVLEVIIEGNGKVPLDAVRRKIKTVPGEPFRLQTVQDDARMLNQTGSFFSVTPRYQRKPEGVVVRFDLVERPIFHSVKFICNEDKSAFGIFSSINKKKFAEIAGIKEGDPVDPQLVLHAREKLKEYLRSEGFERASVVIGMGDRATDRNVVFIINEGVKQRVLSTTIAGGTFLSSMRMKTYITSKPGVLYYIGGEFSREKLDADVETLLDFYIRYGFFNVQIDRVFEDTTGYWGISDPGSWIKVKFVISEGPRFKINNIIFVGNQKFTNEELTKDFKLKPGGYYQQEILKRDEESIKAKYGNQGNLFTVVQGKPRLLADKPGMLDIVYTVRESKRAMITNVEVKFIGDDAHTKTSTFLKYLAGSNIKPGRFATSDMLRRAENSIARPEFVNTNPATGATPKIFIVPEDSDMEIEMEDENFLDKELQEIEALTGNGFSYNTTSPVLDPQDWRRIQQRNGVGIHSGFTEALDYRVAYPQMQDGYLAPSAPSDTSLYGSSPYDGGSYGTSQIGVQQGDYAVPSQYQTQPATGIPTLPAASSPYSTAPYASTVQAGTVPSLPINTNATSSASQPLGFIGQDDYVPSYDNTSFGSLITPSSPYMGGLNNSSSQNSTFSGDTFGTTPGITATPANPIISATTSPNNYFGDTGYGSVTQASGLLPLAGIYNDLGAPGSITRNTEDPYLDMARATARLQVQEGRTGNVMMSVGINSDRGLVGRFSIEECNFDWRKLPTNPFTIAGWRNAFRGAGQRFLIEAMPGQNFQRYMVSFQEPLLGSTRFSLGLNGFYYSRYYDEWRENRTGGGVTLGRAWTDRFSTSLSFNGTNIKVYSPQIPVQDLFDVLGHNAQYAFGLSGTYDTRNNSFFPTEGGVLTVNAEQVIGTHQFVRGSYDLRRYFGFWHRNDGSGPWVLALRSAASITESTTPIYERYYAGGFSTIRGFEYRGVTPRWYGYGIGGNFEFYNSAEVCFPISADDNFRGVFFVDTGTVETSISKWESDYRVAPGFGLRLTIPMMGPVPIAFDFAFPINPNRGDVKQMFSFNIGYSR